MKNNIQIKCFMIVFEDAEYSPEVFTGEQSAEISRKRFDQLSDSWNCHLFELIDTNCDFDNF